MSGVTSDASVAFSHLRDNIVVVKFGGNAMVDDALREDFAEDITILRANGVLPVVVHGAGPQINSMLQRLNIKSDFVDGFRITTSETLEVVRMVMSGGVQRAIVNDINRFNPMAVGLSGDDANMVRVQRRTPIINGVVTDIGLVGDVVAVDAGPLFALLDAGFIPVVSGVGVDDQGTVHNVNADSAAGAIAAAMKAHTLLMLTDVAGLYANWPKTDSLVRTIAVEDLRAMLPTLTTGMIPKMEACLHAVDNGVAAAQVIDGRVSHAVREALARTAQSEPLHANTERFGTTVVSK